MNREQARAKALADEKISTARQEAYEIEHKQDIKNSQVWLSTLKQASSEDYKMWLDHHLDNDGGITHYYNYEMPDIYIATQDIHVTPLFGAMSVDIIVPKGISVSYDKLGHIKIYSYDGPSKGGIVPCYLNT